MTVYGMSSLKERDGPLTEPSLLELRVPRGCLAGRELWCQREGERERRRARYTQHEPIMDIVLPTCCQDK